MDMVAPAVTTSRSNQPHTAPGVGTLTQPGTTHGNKPPARFWLHLPKPSNNTGRNNNRCKNSLITNERQQQPLLTTPQLALQAIQEGHKLPGNLVEVTTTEAEEIADAYQAFAPTDQPLTLFWQGSTAAANDVSQRIRVQLKGSSHFYPTQLVFRPLSAEGCPLPKPAQKATMPTGTKSEEKVLIRFTAPESYRQQFISKQDDPKLSHATAGQLTQGTWKRNYTQHGTQLQGHLKVRKQLAAELLKHSGNYAIFVTQCSNRDTQARVDWHKRERGESNEDHYRRIEAIAKANNKALRYRTRGASDLGTDSDNNSSTPTTLHWKLQGAPPSWDDQDLTTFLAANSDSLFKKLTSATHSCRMANENIRKICYGAAVYLDVVWATRMFHAVIRLRQSGCAWQNKAATCVGLLRRWLANNGWEHLCAEDSQQQPISLALHNIRQQWRRQQFIHWLRGKRHEAHFLLAQFSEQQLLGFFDEVDWEATRLALLHGSAAERSVILGAVVSPLWLHRSGKAYESGHCPWCDDVSGHWMHLAWYCEHMSPAGSVPTNPLLARFGWQLRGSQQYSASCLHWLAAGALACPVRASELRFDFGLFGGRCGCRRGFKAYGILVSTTHNILHPCRGKRAKPNYAHSSYWQRASQHDKQQLITAWKTTLELANRKFDQLTEQGIEPHPGPSSSSCSLTSLNVRSGCGLWRTLKQWQPNRILCLQEIGVKPNELQAFENRAKKHGWKCYHQGSADPQQTHCGVITLVPATWQQRPGKGYAHNRAQLVLTWVWGIAILNHYAPPDSPEDTATNLLVAAAEHNLYTNQWISAGDANGVPVPHKSVVAAAIDSIGGAFHSDGQPTANTGSKNIDWFASSPATLGSNPSRELVSLSDHFPIHLDIDRPTPALAWQGRLQQQPTWRKPQHLETAKWRQHLETTWSDLRQQDSVQTFLHSLQVEPSDGSIQQEWNKYLQVITQLYQQTVQQLLTQQNEDTPLRRDLQQLAKQPKARCDTKGLPATHQWINPPRSTIMLLVTMKLAGKQTEDWPGFMKFNALPRGT